MKYVPLFFQDQAAMVDFWDSSYSSPSLISPPWLLFTSSMSSISFLLFLRTYGQQSIPLGKGHLVKPMLRRFAPSVRLDLVLSLLSLSDITRTKKSMIRLYE
eukprot:CAMPEP_0170092078 /NCGR_PEP_ID=MMETSP0019_2-20121128/25520_1 /TAXON_ID=98059 /ORGANISM="Dinobryon sp., Strain UTEXLB2267" /LENGTH=101 /DNA_ID=CAMNT_0010312297 /DNA_START=80 /DNA_END=382 /DNA_ORIENTATION=-